MKRKVKKQNALKDSSTSPNVQFIHSVNRVKERGPLAPEEQPRQGWDSQHREWVCVGCGAGGGPGAALQALFGNTSALSG